MRRLRNFLKMGMSSRILLFIALILLAAIRLGLLILPFHQLFKLLTSISQLFKSKLATRVTIGQIIWAINVVTRYMPGGAKCLARALTAQVLMNWCDYQAELRIGVAKGETGDLEAHAWIEYQGQVAIGSLNDLSRFVPLPSLEGVRI